MHMHMHVHEQQDARRAQHVELQVHADRHALSPSAEAPRAESHAMPSNSEGAQTHSASAEIVFVTQLPKTPGPKVFSHLRPITILPADAKIQPKAMLRVTEPFDRQHCT